MSDLKKSSNNYYEDNLKDSQKIIFDKLLSKLGLVKTSGKILMNEEPTIDKEV